MMSSIRSRTALATAVFACAVLLFVQPTAALEPIPPPEPKPGSFGLEATKPQAPPTTPARITVPGNGASFSTSPITVSGICTNGLLVQVLNNGVLVGAAVCSGGSFSLQVSLFAGTNELTAIVYDDINQAGPESNTVSVEYTDTSFTAFGDLITLTTQFGRRSSAAGTPLSWPLQLSGGTGPYAFSIDWGDGTAPQLLSQPLSGVVTITHTYERAGIYRANIKVTDVNGVSAFLQIIPVANGEAGDPAAGDTETGAGTPERVILWIPAVVTLLLLIPTFWLGRRSQIVSLRHKLLKQQEQG